MKSFLPVAGLLLLAGCTHIDQAAFQQLDVDMSIEDVEGILGKPSKCTEELGNRSCVWKEGGREIRVNYINNRVVVFSASGLQ